MRRKKATFIDLLEYYFESYLPVAKGLSTATVTSYKATFRLLMEFMLTVRNTASDRISFSILSYQVIIEFLDWLESERKCSISTRNQRLSALNAFAAYAQTKNFEEAVAFRNQLAMVPRKKAPRPVRSSFTRSEIRILLSLPDAGSEIGLRDKNLLCFMYASGMRAQEVCDCTIGDIQFYPDRAGINVHGKGQKIRRIGIPLASAQMLKNYIKHRGISDKYDRHVFSSQAHEKMTVSCIEEIYAKYIAYARKSYPGQFRNNYTPHSMRHTTATHMLEAGVPLIVVKNFLGHVSLQTTEIYTEISQDTMNQKLKAWNDKWFLHQETNEGLSTEKSNVPPFLK